MSITQDKNNIVQFNKWAKTYDTSPWNYFLFYFTNKKVLDMLKPKKNASWLDVGCGTGILLNHLVKLNKNLKLSGLDISKEMLAVAKSKLSKAEVQLSLGSALHMSFKDNSFDYVSCVHSFHHHPNSVESLRGMFRVLKPGGKLLLVDNSLDGLVRILLHKLEQKLFPERESDIQRYTRHKMKELFHKVGFKSIEQQYFLHFALITVGRK